MQSIDELRQQLNSADQERFLILTKVARQDVQSAIEEYGTVQSKLLGDNDTLNNCNDGDQGFDQLTTVSDQSVLIPHNEAAAQSWEDLKKVCNSNYNTL